MKSVKTQTIEQKARSKLIGIFMAQLREARLGSIRDARTMALAWKLKYGTYINGLQQRCFEACRHMQELRRWGEPL